MSFSIIVAFDRNKLIGKESSLPWHLPEDLKYFEDMTKGHSVVMGRKTHECIGKPLPNRQNIVLSSQLEPSSDLIVIRDIKELRNIERTTPTFIIGGHNIYKMFLPLSTKLYITEIDSQFSGDAYFPEFSLESWALVSQSKKIYSPDKSFTYCFKAYEQSPVEIL